MGRPIGLEVVGEAGTVADALVRVPALRPAVIVLDVELPEGTGVALCRDLPRPWRRAGSQKARGIRPGVHSEQILDRQTRALAEVGCLRVFAEKRTGRTAERPELQACLDYLRPGDTLIVVSLDRLSAPWPT